MTDIDVVLSAAGFECKPSTSTYYGRGSIDSTQETAHFALGLCFCSTLQHGAEIYIQYIELWPPNAEWGR